MAYFAGLVACIFYGGWALLVNINAGNENAQLPSLMHGLYAATLTWLVHSIVTKGYEYSNKLTRHPFFITWVTATALSFTLPFLVQLVTGGLRPLVTIAPGFLIGQLYIIGLLYRYSKTKNSQQAMN